jgi:spore maturation protein CgeB
VISPALRPPSANLRIVILGLSITSSWGNGHATTYRSLVKALALRGHDVLFLERDMPWYRANRDLVRSAFGSVNLYNSIDELRARWRGTIARADLVILGSYVPDGISVARFVQSIATGFLAFYDIDTPVTLAALAAGDCSYLSAELIPAFDLYLSFTGGPVLRLLELRYGARAARALYCGVDPDCHRPEAAPLRWDLGYLGTYSSDRQGILDGLMCEPARRWPRGRFAIAGPLYPDDLTWPANLERIEHLDPSDHRGFYSRQRFTLNVTRAAMARTGYSPSVRLFEAAACAVPIISDWWPGLETIFTPEKEILVARSAPEVLFYLHEFPEANRRLIAERARRRVLTQHTAIHRAVALESYVDELRGRNALPKAASAD